MKALGRSAVVGIAGATLALVPAAHAQVAPIITDFPDQVIREFVALAGPWTAGLQAYALHTFMLLATISVAWKLAQLALSGAVMEQIVAELVNLIMFVGLGLFVLGNGPELLRTIIESFRVAGTTASGAGMSPGMILSQAINIASTLFSQMSLWHPASVVVLFLAGVIILICIGWIVACMVLGLVQAALYIPIATFFAAFLGSYWTRDMALAVLRQSFALGAKLLTLELLADATLRLINRLAVVFTAATVSATNAAIVIVASLIMAFFVQKLPDWVAGVIGGASIGEAHAIGRAGSNVAAMTVGAAGGAVAGAVAVGGAGAATAQAARLAGSQAGAGGAAGGAVQTGVGRAASLIGGTAKNLASAAASDVGRRLAGTGGRHGSSPWRMAADLGNQRRLLDDDAKAPVPAANAPHSGGATSSSGANSTAA